MRAERAWVGVGVGVEVRVKVRVRVGVRIGARGRGSRARLVGCGRDGGGHEATRESVRHEELACCTRQGANV